MWIYIFILSIIILAALLNVRSQFVFFSLIIIVGIFLCFGYMTGSDWREYELVYNNLFTNISYNNRMEIGYYFYMLPFVFLGINFWSFFILTKIILYSINVYFLKKFIPLKFYFAFFVFFCLFAMFEFIDNPMRNLIASTIYLFAIKSILDKDIKKYLIICFIAFLFHKSLIFMIPFYFILNKSFKTKKVIIYFVLFNIILLVYSSQLIHVFKLVDLLSSYFSNRMNTQISAYILSDNINDKFTFGLLSRYLIFIILILSKDRIENFSKYGKVAFNASIITLYLHRLVLIWPITLRLSLPFSILFCVSIAMIISVYKRDLKYVYYSVLTFIYLGIAFTQITSSYKYIPYTNYLYYLGDDKPSYYYRSNYNFENSPYKN